MVVAIGAAATPLVLARRLLSAICARLSVPVVMIGPPTRPAPELTCVTVPAPSEVIERLCHLPSPAAYCRRWPSTGLAIRTSLRPASDDEPPPLPAGGTTQTPPAP